MKHIVRKHIIIFCILLSPLRNVAVQSSPYLSIRSQGVNAVRDMVGWQELINRDTDCLYGASALTVEYDHTFRAGRIANSLFNGDENFTNDSGILTISGSRAPDRGTIQWLADYFGLPTNFVSEVTFRPTIKSVIVDPCIYLGGSSQVPGLYALFDFPLVHSSWHLNFSEEIKTTGSQGYSAGYFSDAAQPASSLLPNASSFFTGGSPAITKADGSTIPFDALSAALWSACPRDTVRLADIAVEVGYNFICDENCYLGFKFRATAPTGNKPQGIYVFEPIVGNGGHWEVGTGVIGYLNLWRSQTTDARFSMYLNANLTHLCQAHQTRVFDLCQQGTNSRYMLAERLMAVNNGLEGSLDSLETFNSASILTPSNFQFGDRFTPVANLTRRNVTVEAALQADVAFKFCYNNGKGCSWDVGYNFWGRTHEKICVEKNDCHPSPFETTVWALKGDASVYGFVAGSTLSVALAPTESDAANIHRGSNGFEPGDDTTANNSAAITNANVDNVQFAYQLGVPLQALPSSTSLLEQTNTSIQPTVLAEGNLDLRSTVGLSHKIFANFNYTGKDRGNWTPYVGVGCSGEFAQTAYFEQIPACIDAQSPFRYNKAGISQWSVWTKFGIAFDYGSERSVVASLDSVKPRPPVEVVLQEHVDVVSKTVENTPQKELVQDEDDAVAQVEEEEFYQREQEPLSSSGPAYNYPHASAIQADGDLPFDQTDEVSEDIVSEECEEELSEKSNDEPEPVVKKKQPVTLQQHVDVVSKPVADTGAWIKEQLPQWRQPELLWLFKK